MPKITRLVHYHRPFRFAAFNFEIKLHRNDLLSKWKGKKKTAFAFKEKKQSNKILCKCPVGDSHM